MAVRPITEKATTASRSGAARATIALTIRASSPSVLRDTWNGLVALAFKSAEIEAALLLRGKMPAQDADAIISTFLKQASRRHVVKSDRAKSKS